MRPIYPLSFIKSFGWVILVIFFGWVPQSYSQTSYQTFIGEGKLDSGQNGIIIKSKNLSLADLLQEIQKQSGIEFKLAPEVKDAPFSVNVEASSWTEAILELIEDINHLQVWDGQKKLKQVHLLSLTDPDASLDNIFEKAPNPIKERKNASAQGVEIGDILLNEAQLARIGMSPYRSPISPKLLEDNQIREFLEEHDIKNEEDLKNSKKAMIVRKIARMQLQELRRRRGGKK